MHLKLDFPKLCKEEEGTEQERTETECIDFGDVLTILNLIYNLF